MAEHMHLFSTTFKNEDLMNYVKFKDEIWRILMLLHLLHIIFFARKVLKYVILCSAGPRGHNFADDTKQTCTSQKKFALLVFYGKEDQENHSVGRF